METVDEKVAEPLAAVRRYAHTFEALDPKAVVPYYDEPCLVISSQGSVALPTHAEVERFFEPLMGDLRNQGYAATELSHLEETRLDDTLAIVTGRGIWRTGDGTELGSVLISPAQFVAASRVLLIHSDTFCPFRFAALSTRRSKSGLNRTGTMCAFA